MRADTTNVQSVIHWLWCTYTTEIITDLTTAGANYVAANLLSASPSTVTIKLEDKLLRPSIDMDAFFTPRWPAVTVAF